MSAIWPEIPFEAWRETCAALHLYTQVVGKYRLARTPWVNHSWHATLYVNSRGLTTSLIPDSPGAIGPAEIMNSRRFLSLDLNYGRRVDSEMYEYLFDNGFTKEEYHFFLHHRLKQHCTRYRTRWRFGMTEAPGPMMQWR